MISQQMINEIFQALQPDWAERGLKLEINDRPFAEADSLTLLSDPKSIQRILLELLTNAGKFSAPDTTIYINVTQHQTSYPRNRDSDRQYRSRHFDRRTNVYF